MFTRYKGISIPENYSGNRFKAPIETETKTHKPSPNAVYGGTKTSISPAFEDALRERNMNIDNSIPSEPYTDEEYQEDTILPENNNQDILFDNLDSGSEAEPNDEPRKEKQSSSLLNEFSSLFSQITSKIKQDDLIIIGVILLLLSEKSEDMDVILPLLLLLLYT